jgi:hypothetical protein
VTGVGLGAGVGDGAVVGFADGVGVGTGCPLPIEIAVATIPPVGHPTERDQASAYDGVPHTVTTVPAAREVKNDGHTNVLERVTGIWPHGPCGLRFAVALFVNPFHGAAYV